MPNLSPAEMSPQPLGVAVAGLGFGEKVHLPALAAATDLEAVALWHPRQERLDAATCLLYTSPSPRDATLSRMPSSA